MTRELVQWQILDESCDCVYPWFTHPFLEVLKTWDLKDKKVLEYGGGNSTAWWRWHCHTVVTVESSPVFQLSIREECGELGLANGLVLLAEVNEGDQFRAHEYVLAHNKWIENFVYDIVAVDGILRYECMRHGIELLSRTGGILIVDNWQQDGFVCPACAELVNPYEGHVYRQEDHTDHHGNPWQTAYWNIPAVVQ